MTDTITSLLRAILTNPEDDTVRLAYADALDEQEERETERAAFIRVQVELARTPKMLPPGQMMYSKGGVIVGLTIHPIENQAWSKLNKRQFALFFDGGEGVCYDMILETGLRGVHLEGVGAAQSPAGIVTRGFISSITCTAQDWLKHADTIYWHPEMKVTCPTCHGRSHMWQPHTYCPQCGKCDRGHIPAPHRPTAHPITEVTFTTEPRDTGHLNAFALYKEGKEPWRSYRWPGIAFTHPFERGRAVPGGTGRRTYPEMDEIENFTAQINGLQRDLSEHLRRRGPLENRDRERVMREMIEELREHRDQAIRRRTGAVRNPFQDQINSTRTEEY